MDNYIQINNNNCIYTSFNEKTFQDIINPNTSVILFDNGIINQFILDSFNEKKIDRLIVISDKSTYYKQERLFISNKISKRILNNVKKNLLIVINFVDNYEQTKNVIDNLILLKNLCDEMNINIGVYYKNQNLLGFISSNDSLSFKNNIINSLTAIYVSDQKQRYEFIYDTVCDFLDSEFQNNNYCGFENDSCVRNKQEDSSHTTMGCCYSFEYTSFWDLRAIKDVKLCNYLNCKTCSIKCITCKMFTCKYLKSKNIYYNCKNILLLDCFFNKKQHLILESNFFKTEEQIINKLLEKDNSTYFTYLLKKKYMI